MQGDDLLGGFGLECGGIATVRRPVQGAKGRFNPFLNFPIEWNNSFPRCVWHVLVG
jgi:hypothetical protein